MANHGANTNGAQVGDEVYWDYTRYDDRGRVIAQIVDAASGVNFGFRRTVPHMLGISIGHAVMVFLVGLGLAGVFRAWPPALTGLKVASVAYMLWLAWKIARAGSPGEGRARAAPMTFLQASMPVMLAGLCRGAKGMHSRTAAITFSSIFTEEANFSPPCTRR